MRGEGSSSVIWKQGEAVQQHPRAGPCAGTYALQAVLALHRLHAAGADAVAEPLQMLLYLTDFPRKKNNDKIPSQCSAAVWIIIFSLCFNSVLLSADLSGSKLKS